MNSFIVKNFRKKEAIKIFLIKSDKRITTHWVIPDKTKVTINGYTFELIEDKMFFSNGVPAFICTYKSAEPIDPNDIERFTLSADDYNTAISAQVAREIFSVTSNKVDMQMISVILSGICLIAIVFLFITFSESLNQILAELKPTVTTLQQTTGGN